MTLAILCPGQGLQHANMFALTGDAPEAGPLFARATTLLGGHDPRELVRKDTADAVHQNRVAQILCTLNALAATAALRDTWPARRIIAGYSVGEIAAWSIAGWAEGTITLDLVAQRAEAMDASSEHGDGLLFVSGLSLRSVEHLCMRHDAAIAIINPGDACILGGSGVVLDSLAFEAKAIGAARIVRLAVNVASHTPRLAGASSEFRKLLDQVPAKTKFDAGVRLFSGIDGAPVFDIPIGLNKLAKQISHTVHWADCLEACMEAGASSFLELGPGRALTEMVTNAYPGTHARSLEDFRTLQGVRAWIAGLPGSN
jgi:[acyl-carrier-protein] S-malonyltransferase